MKLGDVCRGGVGDGLPGRNPRALVGDGAAAPAGVRREDPVVEHRIDAGAGGQGGELFEELEGFEEEVAGAVGPLAFELHEGRPVRIGVLLVFYRKNTRRVYFVP